MMFKRGDVNPKGGLYTLDHLTRVLIENELIEGVITGETRCYYRIRVDGESYSSQNDGRLKIKHLVKQLRNVEK